MKRMRPAVPEAGSVAFHREGRVGLLGVAGDVPLPSAPATAPDSIQTSDALAAIQPGPAVSPVSHAIILLSIIVPTFLLVSAFSVSGWGDATYIGLASWDAPWYAAAAVDVVLLVVLWTLDAPSWTRPALVLLRRACVLVLVAFVGIACSLATKVYPFAPLQFSLLLIPACCFASRHFLMPSATSSSVYLASLSNSLVAVAGLLTLYFVLWVFALPPPDSRIRTGWHPEWVNIWGGDVKQYWRTRLGCEPCAVPCNASEIANDSDWCAARPRTRAACCQSARAQLEVGSLARDRRASISLCAATARPSFGGSSRCSSSSRSCYSPPRAACSRACSPMRPPPRPLSSSSSASSHLPGLACTSPLRSPERAWGCPISWL